VEDGFVRILDRLIELFNAAEVPIIVLVGGVMFYFLWPILTHGIAEIVGAWRKSKK
jgi:hypothetical protein